MIKINEDCIGCGVCVSICPKVFAMKEDRAIVKEGQENSKDDCVKEAIKECPVDAISNSRQL